MVKDISVRSIEDEIVNLAGSRDRERFSEILISKEGQAWFNDAKVEGSPNFRPENLSAICGSDGCNGLVRDFKSWGAGFGLTGEGYEKGFRYNGSGIDMVYECKSCGKKEPYGRLKIK